VRTTVNIDAQLLDWAKDVARQRNVTLGDLFDEALERHLARPLHTDGPELPIFQGESGVMPGVDLNSNRSMFDALDDAEDLHA
jgi:hypothetical protein